MCRLFVTGRRGRRPLRFINYTSPINRGYACLPLTVILSVAKNLCCVSNNQNAQWSVAFKRLRRRFFALFFCYANVPSSAQNDTAGGGTPPLRHRWDLCVAMWRVCAAHLAFVGATIGRPRANTVRPYGLCVLSPRQIGGCAFPSSRRVILSGTNATVRRL